MATTGSSNNSSPLTDEQCAASARGSNTACDRRAICQKCLTIDGCMIDDYGDCATQTGQYLASKDYKAAIPRNVVKSTLGNNTESYLSQSHYYYFKAGDATYCDQADAECTACHAAEFYGRYAAPYTDSRFCVGAKGCVCIFNCEFTAKSSCPSLNPTITLEPSAMTPKPTTPTPTTKVSPQLTPHTTSPSYYKSSDSESTNYTRLAWVLALAPVYILWKVHKSRSQPTSSTREAATTVPVAVPVQTRHVPLGDSTRQPVQTRYVQLGDNPRQTRRRELVAA